MRLERALKRERELLSAFSKYLPHEKGYVLNQAVSKAQSLPAKLTPEMERLLSEFYDLTKLLSFQKSYLMFYLAFLLSVLEYEEILKEKEYDGDSRRAQLIDERLIAEAKALKRESRKGRKPAKRRKLEALRGEILMLRSNGIGLDTLVKFLWRRHRLKVSKPYLYQVLKEWESGRQPTQTNLGALRPRQGRSSSLRFAPLRELHLDCGR